MSTGVLITFEGGEGSGKSTHIARLRDTLEKRGYEVVVTREPGGTKLGEAIRAILLSNDQDQMSPRAELLLYEAARAQIVDEIIKPAMEAGKVVLCDRYIDSTVAYQGFGRGLDRAMIEKLNASATGGIMPDRTIVLSVPVDAGLKRAMRKGKPDRLESQPPEFHHAVFEGFERIAELESDRVRIVDATRPKESVAAEVARIADEVLGRVR